MAEGRLAQGTPPPVHANGKNERACDVKKRDNYNLPLVNRVQDGAVEDNRGVFFSFFPQP